MKPNLIDKNKELWYPHQVVISHPIYEQNCEKKIQMKQ